MSTLLNICKMIDNFRWRLQTFRMPQHAIRIHKESKAHLKYQKKSYQIIHWCDKVFSRVETNSLSHLNMNENIPLYKNTAFYCCQCNCCPQFSANWKYSTNFIDNLQNIFKSINKTQKKYKPKNILEPNSEI